MATFPAAPAAAGNPVGTWQRLAGTSVRAFHAYGGWLVGISWPRFALLAILLIAGAGVLSNLPPFNWTISETVEAIESPSSPPPPAAPDSPAAPAAPGASKPAERKRPLIHIEKSTDGKPDSVEISIDEHGVRIKPKRAQAPASAPPPGAPASSPAALAPPPPADAVARAAAELAKLQAAATALPEGPAREAMESARVELEEALRELQVLARERAEEARQAAEEARQAAAAVADTRPAAKRQRVTRVALGEYLPNMAVFWVLASAIMKISYKRQIQAEAQAAQAVETAEAESLKRQVVEARMAAMQAQVEPHFLFNTLASIDHLIEVDPPRASQMQKNLIALLRASMPSLREASDGGVRDLGRELAVIKPYLEILKVRMEERLATELHVPDGLLSAEFPPMMVQTLVENAIKHGLEPKPEGGRLRIAAEIVHGKLAVTVADTGLGFGRAATAGTGVGLANIRERLALLYGHKASVTITETPGGGTTVAIAVPYRPVQAAEGVAA